MKIMITILSAIFAILLVLTLVLNFGSEDSQNISEPVTTIPSESTALPTTTQTPTTVPTTTTEPEPVVESSGKTVIYEGKALETYYIDGGDTLMALASDLQEEGEYIPLLETVAQREYPMWEDEESGILYITPSAKRFAIPEDVDVPVLMYHAVSDYMWGISELFVSPSEMEKQLAYLVENGYDPIWFEDLSHVEDYDKPVILTFDDGYDDNYTELFPLLQKYQVKATIFIIGNAMGMSHKMTAEQVKELSDSGLVSIQSHGYTHNNMDAMGAEELEYELGETWRVLTRVTGKIPSVLCYPSGRYYSKTLEIAEKYYNFGLKMNGNLYNTSVDDPYLVSRYYIARYTDIYTFAAYVAEAE